MRGCISTLAAVAVLEACVPSQQVAFEPLRAGVEARLGREVRWIEEEEDARLVDEEVRRLLSRELGLEDAVQIALLHDRGLRARFAELGVARALLLQASLPPNPVVQGQVLAPVDEGETRGGLTAQIDFLGVLLLSEQRALALTELEATRLELLALALEVAGDVSLRFHTFLAARERVGLLEDVVELTERALLVAARREREGDLERLEQLELEAEATEARLALLEARAEMALAHARLGAALGLTHLDDWRVPASLPEPAGTPLDSAALVETAVERSLALELARRRVEVTARTLGIADARRLLPDLTAGATSEVEDGDLFIGPQLQVEVPLFNQGQGRVAEQAAELRGWRDEYRARLVQLVTTADATRQQLTLARERVAYLDERALPSASAYLDEALREHEAGRVGELELLEARRALLDLKLQRVAALLDYWLARDTYELLMSGGLPEQTGSLALDP